MPIVKETVESIGLVVDGAGVFVIVVGLLLATFRFAALGRGAIAGYRRFRHDLVRGILLGPEFLVAADIIRAVSVASTLEGVLVLGPIVLVRTFLSMALQVELDGRWPWGRVDAVEQGSATEARVGSD